MKMVTYIRAKANVCLYKSLSCVPIIILSFFLYTNFAWAQSDSTIVDSIQFTPINQISLQAKLFSTDKLQQAYLVNAKNELTKLSPNGDILFRYNNNRLGSLQHIDVANPFNILLYYPDFRTVITLDRTLSQTGEFNLYDLDVIEVETVAMSNDNNIWLYDDVGFKLKKINHKGKTLLESDNLSMTLGTTLKPNFIMERDNQVFVNDPLHGIFVFDNFASYIKKINVLDLDYFQIFNDQLIYLQDGKLISFQMQALSTIEIKLPEERKNEEPVFIQSDRVFIIQENQVLIFGY